MNAQARPEPCAYPPVEVVLPHAKPMVLLDRILNHSDQATECEVVIGPHSQLRTENGSVPGYVGLEYLAQCVGAHAGMVAYRLGQPVEVGFLLGTRRLELHVDRYEPGQRLRARAEHVWGESELSSFQCTLRDAETNEVLAEGKLSAYRPKNLDAFLKERDL